MTPEEKMPGQMEIGDWRLETRRFGFTKALEIRDW